MFLAVVVSTTTNSTMHFIPLRAHGHSSCDPASNLHNHEQQLQKILECDMAEFHDGKPLFCCCNYISQGYKPKICLTIDNVHSQPNIPKTTPEHFQIITINVLSCMRI